MKNANVKELLKSKKILGSIAALAVTVVVGGTAIFQSVTTVPEFPQIMEPIMEMSIEEDEVPLAAAPKVETKTTTKKSSKNVKLSKKATKTYTQKLPTTTKKSTANSSTSTATIKTETTTVTATTEKYTKNSNVKVVTTEVKTTVKTTTTAKPKPTPTPVPKKYYTTIEKMAPKMDARVTKAWNTFKFKILVDPSVKYSGYFDAKGQLITLNANQVTSFPDTIYHELGHFLAFIAGNVDTKADFKAIYTAEKGKLTGVSAAYAKQSSSEFFAECTRLYVVDNANLKKACPKTYAAIQKALDSVTDTRIKLLQKTYGAYWK